NPFDGEDGRALDRTPGEPDRLVESPRIEPHRARGDDAEVAADEVRVGEVAEAETDPLSAEQDLPAPDVGEDAEELDGHGDEEPGEKDAQVEPPDLGPQLGRLGRYELEALDADPGLRRGIGETDRSEATVRRARVDGRQTA